MYAPAMETQAPPHLGDTVLDADHARLHQCIGALLQAPDTGQVAALDALRACAAEHFAAEDDDLRRMGDGNSQCHLDEHGAVLKSLDEVREVLTGDQVDAAGKSHLVWRLGLQLADWLPHHVQEMDEAVARHRVKQRFGGAPVRIAKRGPA